jgi:hypothetical protein
MMKFGTYEELKSFIETIFDFIPSIDFGLPHGPHSLVEGLDRIEESLIINIYDSYRRRNGKIIKQVAGHFLHLLHLLVPSQRFTNIFRELIHLEWMEHRIKHDASKKFYRDHILHCASVCWVGQRLIFDLEEPFLGSLRSCLDRMLPPACKRLLTDEKRWESFIKITWYITAMLHDFGYPVELVEKKYASNGLYVCSKDYLQTCDLKNYFDKQFPHTAPFFKERLQSIDSTLLQRPFHKSGAVHPVLGCIELLHFLKSQYRQLKHDRAVYRYIYQLAAVGIFEHHKEGKLDFDTNPFGYILALADTIHEWKRYVCTGTAVNWSTKLKFISPITRVFVRRKGTGKYKIQFWTNPHYRKCKGWDPDFFKQAKQEELNRLISKPGLPQMQLPKTR